MHARQLAEIGGWIAICSNALDQNNNENAVDDGLKYWAASKCRIQRWQQAIKVFEDDLQNPQPMHDPWPAINVVIQEILISDLLTRTWTAALVSQNHASLQDLQSIGQSIYIGHLEIRNRALKLILEHRDTSEKHVQDLDELRRRIERWTDMLLSRMDNLAVVKRFGFDTQRIEDFASDRNLESRRRRREVEQILMASLANSLQTDGGRYTANPDLNREIAAGILGSIPTDRFESFGMPKSVLHMQMEQVQNDTQAMVQQLINEEQQLN